MDRYVKFHHKGGHLLAEGCYKGQESKFLFQPVNHPSHSLTMMIPTPYSCAGGMTVGGDKPVCVPHRASL